MQVQCKVGYDGQTQGAGFPPAAEGAVVLAVRSKSTTAWESTIQAIDTQLEREGPRMAAL